VNKDTLDYFNRRIYENQKEFFLENIPRTFNRYYIGETIRRGQSSNNVIENMINKPWGDSSPSKKNRKQSSNKL
jgi:hypothetical protein